MQSSLVKFLTTLLGVALCLYTLAAVNYTVLQPQSERAIFVGLGMVLCFLVYPFAIPIKEGETYSFRSSLATWFRKGQFPLPAGAAWPFRITDFILVGLTVVCFGYMFVQTEPLSLFKMFWADPHESLIQRAGTETTLDIVIGGIGLLLVLESTRRSIGWIVPLLAVAFMLHAFFARDLPDWMLAHPGKDVTSIVSDTFLQSTGVLGPAAGVMFKYVFLFVVFGAFLEMSGATQFIIDFAERIFGRSPGGPAKVAVLGSGLMGSLSGSAVANAVTTGSFTIPMMRNSGFSAPIAGGITAAAAAGGALVPPVMGAGAYMMLEFVDRPSGQPAVTFLEIAKAALIPALLYYLSIFLIVHFYSRKLGSDAVTEKKPATGSLWQFEAIVFFGALGVLVALLIMGLSAFKAVTGALVLILVLSIFRQKLELGFWPRVLALATFVGAMLLHQGTMIYADSVPSWAAPYVSETWLSPVDGEFAWRQAFDSLLNSSIAGMFALLIFGMIHTIWRPEIIKALTSAAKNGIALVAASACVGIIIGIVQTTPMANDFSEAIKGIVESSLLLALIGIMVCSLVLGMGVPSVVCYLLMATLMGALLKQMGVDPLAAHLFIFYYGMMSMVTPPVALAAYASASIAKAPIMDTAVAAFRFSLVGFTLPFMFIYRPALLLMNDNGGNLLSFEMIRGVFTGSVAAGDLLTPLWRLFIALAASIIGVVALAAGVTGYFKTNIGWWGRGLLCISAAMLFFAPNVAGRPAALAVNIAGAVLFVLIAVVNWQRAGKAASGSK